MKQLITKNALHIFLTVFCLAVVTPTTATEPPASTNSESDINPKVRLTTNVGELTIELYPQKAPETVKNFLQYASDGFYTDTIFHRVIDGFMIQGGGFTLGFDKKETRQAIQNEADNHLANIKYSIAMARTQDPHSATAQFFINSANNEFLNHRSKDIAGWGYTVFGQVIDGKDIADKIGKTPTGAAGPFNKDVPTNPIVIESVTLIEPE